MLGAAHGRLTIGKLAGANTRYHVVKRTVQKYKKHTRRPNRTASRSKPETVGVIRGAAMLMSVLYEMNLPRNQSEFTKAHVALIWGWVYIDI